MKRPPDPLEWHPAYAGYTDLLDWLNKPGGPHRVFVARMEPARITAMGLDPYAPMPEPWALDRRRVTAPAPYVGRPFVYAWHFATDQLGRVIAGKAWIQYTEDEATWMMRDGTLD